MVHVAGSRNGGAHAFADRFHDLIVHVAVILPRLDAVPRYDFGRRFHRIAVEFHVPGADCVGRIGPGFVHAYRPDPYVDPDWFH